MSQHMDQGIIENLKRHYKKLLLRRRLVAMDEGKNFKFNLLDALDFVRSAWNRVSALTIRNCFAKTNFVEEEIQNEPDDTELAELWMALPVEERIHEDEEIELADFLEADDRLATGGTFMLEEIDDDEPIEEEPAVHFEEAQRALSTVRKFLVTNSSDPIVMQACDRLEDKMQEIRRKRLRQPTILESFGLE